MRRPTCLMWFLIKRECKKERNQLKQFSGIKAMIEFNLKTMAFLGSYPVTGQWTYVGYNDMKVMFDRGEATGDYSEMFWGLYDLLQSINLDKYEVDQLWTELFKIKAKGTSDGDRMVEAVYGGSVKSFEDQPMLIFGNRYFPITQKGKRLSIGALEGDLVAMPYTDEGGKSYYKIAWQPELTIEDRYYMYSFPVILASDKEGKALHKPSPEFVNRDIAKGNLLTFLAVQSEGNSDFTRYGVVNNRIEGERIYKAYDLIEGIGTASFNVIGVQSGIGKKKDSDETFQSVMFQLADGRKANANSRALAEFDSWSEEEREASIPFIWQVDKYAAAKSSSAIKMIPKAKAVSGTKFPDAPWLKAVANSPAIEPTKSAVAVAADGSSADDIPF
jgi:hypothetical protein